MKKKMPKWVWAIIIPAALMAALFVFIIVMGVVTYLKSDPLPEGFTESHHSYDEMLEFARTIDPDATVSETYTDHRKNDNQTIREWPATINGIECVVASTPEMFLDKKGSAFTRIAFGMDTDYDQIAIGMVLENYPELGEVYEQRFTYSVNAVSADGSGNTDDVVIDHPRTSVRSVIILDSIDEETFDKIWDSYVKAYQDYASYNPTRGYAVTIKLSDGGYHYLDNTSEEEYQSVKDDVIAGRTEDSVI